jgi:DNA gyrase subunit A
LAIRFEESKVRAMGRPAGGVTGLRFKREGDQVVSMVVVPNGGEPANCMILTACVNGYGKRTPYDEYRLTGRGGSGVINIDASERNGDVIGMTVVCDTDELMMITEKGILMRTKVTEIRATGRNAQGVTLINLDEGDKLVAMAKIDAKESPAGEGPTGETPEGTEPPPETPEAK